MEKLKLQNQMCFKFYAISKHITGLYKTLLEDLNLTYPQYLTMLVLWEHGSISVNDIGKELLLDSGTLTPLLKRLEQKELLKRIRSSADERRVEIHLTEKGKNLKQKAVCIPDELIAGITMEGAEILQLNETLNKMMASIKQ